MLENREAVRTGHRDEEWLGMSPGRAELWVLSVQISELSHLDASPQIICTSWHSLFLYTLFSAFKSVPKDMGIQLGSRHFEFLPWQTEHEEFLHRFLPQKHSGRLPILTPWVPACLSLKFNYVLHTFILSNEALAGRVVHHVTSGLSENRKTTFCTFGNLMLKTSVIPRIISACLKVTLRAFQWILCSFVHDCKVNLRYTFMDE